MENTNTNSETITQEELINNIFSKYNPTPAPTQEQPIQTVEPTIQNQEVQPQEPAQPAPVVEPVLEAPKPITDYSRRLQGLIQDGLIENFAINYQDQEVFLEDIKDLTEEGYQQIINGWKTEKAKEQKEKYLSLDGLDETTKKLIEIKRAGGDIKEIIKENVSAIDVLQQYKDNIDNQNVQINIVGDELTKKGLSLKTVQNELHSLIESGELETKATEILESQLQFHSQAIENKRQEEYSRIEQEKENLKNLRKDLTAEYKALNIPENLHKILVDNATKLDADKISNTDKLYFEAIKDPKKYARLNFYLNNEAEFEKWISSKATTSTKIKMMEPLFTVNINNTKKPNIQKNTIDDYAQSVLQKQQQ